MSFRVNYTNKKIKTLKPKNTYLLHLVLFHKDNYSIAGIYGEMKNLTTCSVHWNVV